MVVPPSRAYDDLINGDGAEVGGPESQAEATRRRVRLSAPFPSLPLDCSKSI